MTSDEYQAARAEMRRLWGVSHKSAEGKRLEELAVMIERYEREHFPRDWQQPESD